MTAEATKIGARLRELRAQSGLTLKELSERSGMYTGNLVRLERGDHRPMLESVVRYARGLGVPVSRVTSVLDQPAPALVPKASGRDGRTILQKLEELGAGLPSPIRNAVRDRARERESRLRRILDWSSAAPDRTFEIGHGVRVDHEWTGSICDQRAAYPDDGSIVDVFDQSMHADTLDGLLDELVAAIDAMERAGQGAAR